MSFTLLIITSPVVWLMAPTVATPVLLDVAEMTPLPFRFTVNFPLLALLFSVRDVGLMLMVLSPLAIPQVAVLGPVSPSGHCQFAVGVNEAV